MNYSSVLNAEISKVFNNLKLSDLQRVFRLSSSFLIPKLLLLVTSLSKDCCSLHLTEVRSACNSARILSAESETRIRVTDRSRWQFTLRPCLRTAHMLYKCHQELLLYLLQVSQDHRLQFMVLGQCLASRSYSRMCTSIICL